MIKIMAIYSQNRVADLVADLVARGEISATFFKYLLPFFPEHLLPVEKRKKPLQTIEDRGIIETTKDRVGSGNATVFEGTCC